jgi:hypothetical protein
MNCDICKRPLNVDSDPLSIDCGGHCWGCVGAFEVEMGNEESTKRVREEHALGLRSPMSTRPIKTHSNSMATELQKAGWVVSSVITATGDVEPYEYILEWPTMTTLTMRSWKKGLQTVSLIGAVKEYSTGSLGQAKAEVERLLAGEAVTLKFLSESAKREFKKKAESLGAICD